jgi:hypothetical protein
MTLQRRTGTGSLLRFPWCYKVGNIGALMRECCCPFHCSYWVDFDLPAEDSNDWLYWFMVNYNPVQVSWSAGRGYWYWEDFPYPSREHNVRVERTGGQWVVSLNKYCPVTSGGGGGNRTFVWQGVGTSELDPSGAYPELDRVDQDGDCDEPEYIRIPSSGSVVISVVEIP